LLTQRLKESDPMATNRVYRIAVIPATASQGGRAGRRAVLEAAAKKFGFELRQDDYDFASTTTTPSTSA